MDILISANEAVLTIITKSEGEGEIAHSDDMDEKQFRQWLDAMKGEKATDGNSLEEIPV